MKETKVKIREQDKMKSVKITGSEKPQVHDEFTEKWQRILNLFSKILNVPSGLIMKITEDSMEVFLRNTNRENPYRVGSSDKLGHGLYCETVIGTDSELVIENALNSTAWKDNPDVTVNMISYYGIPIKWPDGEFYGTLCVLDNKTKVYGEDFKMIMREFRQSIEKDLEIMCLNKELRFYSEIDALTNIFNRRYCDRSLAEEFERSQRTGIDFSVAIFELDHFKSINDTLGHEMGDKVLKVFSKAFDDRVRTIDTFGRYGGDEFMLICPGTDLEGVEYIITSIREEALKHMRGLVQYADFSYGISEYRKYDKSVEDVLKRADDKMYENKRSKY